MQHSPFNQRPEVSSVNGQTGSVEFYSSDGSVTFTPQADGRRVDVTASGGGGSGNTIVTPVTTGNSYTVTAASGLGVFPVYNTSGVPFTFFLPPIPAGNEIITITDAGLNADTLTITVDGNGEDIGAYGSVQTTIDIASKGGSVTLAWDGIQWNQYA